LAIGRKREKKDSGSARQGETKYQQTCNYPNRLNLLISTAGRRPRSNFLQK
jgi:hypothetical protein